MTHVAEDVSGTGNRQHARGTSSELETRSALEQMVFDLRSAQRMARLSSWQWDPAADRVVWSKELFEMFGLDPETPPPSFAEQAALYSPDSLRDLTAAVEAATSDGVPYDLEIEFIRVDQTRGWMRSWGEAVYDDGVVVEIRGYSQEITEQVEARRLLERSEHTLRETQRMAQLGSWEWEIADDKVTWSDGLFDLFGLDPTQPPPSFADQAKLYDTASWEQLGEAVEATTQTGIPYVIEGEIVRANGDRRWVQIRGEVVRGEADAIVGLRGFILDITQRKEVERALAASESLFRTAMLASPIGMALTELDGSFRVVNHALCELLGRDEAWLTSHGIDDVTHPEDRERRSEQVEATNVSGTVEELDPVRLIRSDGQVLWVKRAAELIPGASGAPDHLLVQYVDTTAEHIAVEKLTYRAFHDPLTGLHNRESIMSGLKTGLDEAHRTSRRVGVLFIDLDNFKIVNDSLGHAAGDEVLMTVADRIDGVLRPPEQVGRSGGDEFIVVVPDAADAHQVEQVAERIVTAVGTELIIRGHRMVPTVSIGLALSNPDSTSSSLLRDADAALFSAKAAGRSRWKLFDAAMHAQALERLTTEGEIRRGLVADEFVVYYQPIVTLADRRIVGHEALVRWNHPTRGLLGPEHFLPTAEDSGLIIDIGHHVLEQVCALLASSADRLGAISVNFSPVQLAGAGWLDAFIDTLTRHDVDPRRIVVEVTETAVLSLLPGTDEDLAALRTLGVGLHVDDFGTGFSSISLLRDLPVTGIKLDASFVADLTGVDDAASALSAGLAGLVNGLHLTGVAEGVETEVQHRILATQGWSHAQGFLYGRPRPQPVMSDVAPTGEQAPVWQPGEIQALVQGRR